MRVLAFCILASCSKDPKGGCPGWDPVVHFEGGSTPAGGGMAGALFMDDGFGVLPPFGACYSSCRATATGDDVAAAYTWDDRGFLTRARLDSGEGRNFAYNDVGLLKAFGYVEANGPDVPWNYTYDNHEEVKEARREDGSTIVTHDNSYRGDHLTTTTRTLNGSPLSIEEFTWKGAELVATAGTLDATETSCAPDYGRQMTYDDDLRVHEVDLESPCSSGVILDREYEYDREDRLVQVVFASVPGPQTQDHTWTLEYDRDGRGSVVQEDETTIAFDYECP